MDWRSLLMWFLGLGVVADLLSHWLLPWRRKVENNTAAESDVDVELKRLELELRRKEVEVRRKEVDLELAEKDVEHYKHSITELHERIRLLNDENERLLQRDSDKELRFDQQTEKLRETQRNYSVAMNRIAEILEENGNLKGDLAWQEALTEHYRFWHCRRNDCGKNRIPPNERLKGMVYVEPQRGRNRSEGRGPSLKLGAETKKGGATDGCALNEEEGGATDGCAQGEANDVLSKK